MSPDEIRGGRYVLTALSWDEVTSEPGKPLEFKRHRQGDTVTLNVEDARRLVLGGAVRKPGELEAQQAAALQAQATAALAAVPEELREQFPPDPRIAELEAQVAAAQAAQQKAQAEADAAQKALAAARK